MNIRIALLFFFAFVLPAGAQTPAARLGFIATLTGNRASFGKDALDAAQLALDDLKRGNPSMPVQLVVEDSQGDPRQGVNAYKKLRTQDLKFILTQNSNVSLPISQLVNRDGVLQLAFNTTADRYSTPNDLTFRVNGPTNDEAEVLAAYMEKRLAREPGKAALLTIEDEYPQSLKANLLAGLERRKITLAFSEDFPPKETDFRSLIAKLKSNRIAYVMLLSYQVETGSFVKQARELHLGEKAIIASSPARNREFFETAGPAAEGVVIAYFHFNLAHPAAIEYQRRYSKPVNFAAANAYDAVYLAGTAFQKCGFREDIPCLSGALTTVRNFDGVSGKRSFDDTFGDMRDSYTMLIAKGGEFVPLPE